MNRHQEEVRITLEAQGKDAREIFAELFHQSRHNFVLNVAIDRKVYLNLKEVPFFEALQLLCEATQTRFAVRNGIYYIEPISNSPLPPISTPPSAKRVRLVGNALPLRTVAREIERQTGVKITVDPDVPELQFSLNLPQSEVETVLEAICQGTGLRWERVNGGYRIRVVEPPKVSAPSLGAPAQSGGLRAGTARPRTAPSRPALPERPLKCPKCGYALQLDWKYCPICGAYVKHLTDRAKREQNAR